ncbi:hypothetical protein ED857_19890 [Acinetobacter baumannii]|nr:hypothetical protein ED857_19890 [Acinetobacter baumannii]
MAEAQRRMIGAHHEIHQRKLVELELQQRNEELFDWNLRLEELVAERTEALHRVNQALALGRWPRPSGG